MAKVSEVPITGAAQILPEAPSPEQSLPKHSASAILVPGVVGPNVARARGSVPPTAVSVAAVAVARPLEILTPPLSGSGWNGRQSAVASDRHFCDFDGFRRFGCVRRRNGGRDHQKRGRWMARNGSWCVLVGQTCRAQARIALAPFQQTPNWSGFGGVHCWLSTCRVAGHHRRAAGLQRSLDHSRRASRVVECGFRSGR